MTSHPAVQTPLAIDRVERTRGKQDQVRLRCTGHWLTADHPDVADPLLVVQLHGRRHRFPARAEPLDDSDPARPFTASFTIPDWAVPEQPGQAVLWVGDAVVPVPPPGTSAPAPARAYPHPALAGSEPEPGPGPALVRPATPEPGESADEAAPAPGRSGPLAQLLFKETVDALHAELEQRSAESVQLRGALAQLRADLDRRSASQSELETAHAELREELQRLMGAVSGQREEFERRVATAVAERDAIREQMARSGEELARSDEELGAVRGELDGVREQLTRVEQELAGAHAELTRARSQFEDRMATERSDFDQRLAAARAESETALAAARREAEADAAAAREAAESEAAAARTRAESELAADRAESEAMLIAARGHSDSRALAAEARADELSDRIATLQAAQQHRDAEVSALREQLASAHISRDAALGEADGLRIELDRLASELGALREQAGPPGGDLSDAQRLLADARALTERLRGESGG